MALGDIREGMHHARMNLLADDDQRAMREAVRDFLTDALPAPTADCAAWADIDPDRSRWRRMANELGLQGLTIDEEHGGQGFGMSEAGIVFEELGRALCAAPVLGTSILAGRVLQRVGPAGSDLLSRIASGELMATASLTASGGIRVSEGTGPRLTGRLDALIEGADADVVIVLAQGPQEPGLYAVDLTGAGVTRTAQAAVDLTRSFARIDLSDASATVLAEGRTATDVAAQVLDEGVICLAAESVGAARRALESAVEYSRTRRQFGQPIGSFQALKHRMADILIAVEGAWSTARYAAVLADTSPSPVDLGIAASAAKVAADRALAFASAECIQIHGGIGFTWEYSAHLAYRRSASNAQLLGAADVHRARIIELMRRTA